MVAQTAIVGSILANALLVLGLVIVVGCAPLGRRPHALLQAPAHDTATLLQVTVFIIVLLGLSLASHDPASHHVEGDLDRRRRLPADRLPAWVVPYLRSDTVPGEGDGRSAGAGRSSSAASGASGEADADRARRRGCRWR